MGVACYHGNRLTPQVKIKLPIRLSRRHHVLITLLHISCETPKGSKGAAAKGGRQPPIETVGMLAPPTGCRV